MKQMDNWDLVAMISSKEEDAAQVAAEYLEARIYRREAIDEVVAQKMESLGDALADAAAGQPMTQRLMDRYNANHGGSRYNALQSVLVGLSMDHEEYYCNVGLMARWEDVTREDDGTGSLFWFEDLFGYEQAPRAEPTPREKSSIAFVDLTQAKDGAQTGYSFKTAGNTSYSGKKPHEYAISVKSV